MSDENSNVCFECGEEISPEGTCRYCRIELLSDQVDNLAKQLADARSNGRRAIEQRDNLKAEKDEYRSRCSGLDAQGVKNRGRIQDLELELAEVKAKRFPIMEGPSIPWAMILPHDRQAQCNHDQTLKRLASRGGLSCCEALAVLDDRRWKSMDEAEAHKQLSQRLEKWEGLEKELAEAKRLKRVSETANSSLAQKAFDLEADNKRLKGEILSGMVKAWESDREETT